MRREVEPEHRGCAGPVGGEAPRRDARGAAEVDHHAACWHDSAERGQCLVEGAAERQLAVGARLRKVARPDGTWQSASHTRGEVLTSSYQRRPISICRWAAKRFEWGTLTRSDLSLEGGLPAEVAGIVGVEGFSIVVGHGHTLLLRVGENPWAARFEPRKRIGPRHAVFLGRLDHRGLGLWDEHSLVERRRESSVD